MSRCCKAFYCCEVSFRLLQGRAQPLCGCQDSLAFYNLLCKCHKYTFFRRRTLVLPSQVLHQLSLDRKPVIAMGARIVAGRVVAFIGQPMLTVRPKQVRSKVSSPPLIRLGGAGLAYMSSGAPPARAACHRRKTPAGARGRGRALVRG